MTEKLEQLPETSAEAYALGFKNGWRGGRDALIEDIVARLKPTLARDATQQKVVSMVEEFK
jgi:hypothetical protein